MLIKAIVLTCLFTLCIFSTEIKLSNGKTFKGSIVSEDENSIVLKIGSSRIKINKSLIVELDAEQYVYQEGKKSSENPPGTQERGRAESSSDISDRSSISNSLQAGVPTTQSSIKSQEGKTLSVQTEISEEKIQLLQNEIQKCRGISAAGNVLFFLGCGLEYAGIPITIYGSYWYSLRPSYRSMLNAGITLSSFGSVFKFTGPIMCGVGAHSVQKKYKENLETYPFSKKKELWGFYISGWSTSAIMMVFIFIPTPFIFKIVSISTMYLVKEIILYMHCIKSSVYIRRVNKKVQSGSFTLSPLLPESGSTGMALNFYF